MTNLPATVSLATESAVLSSFLRQDLFSRTAAELASQWGAFVIDTDAQFKAAATTWTLPLATSIAAESAVFSSSLKQDYFTRTVADIAGTILSAASLATESAVFSSFLEQDFLTRTAATLTSSWDYVAADMDNRLKALATPSAALLVTESVFPISEKPSAYIWIPAEPAPSWTSYESIAATPVPEEMTDAYKLICGFETQLRCFIDHKMTSAFGPGWTKTQIPGDMRRAWEKKLEKSVKAGEIVTPLINYADFTDYVTLIVRRDNWNRAFKNVFRRKESVQESFYRLNPIRIRTMHIRILTADDLLLLQAEIRQLTKYFR